MNHSSARLFTTFLLEDAPAVASTELEGAYDPSEQLWVSDGAVVACLPAGSFCLINAECCPILGIAAVCLLNECIL